MCVNPRVNDEYRRYVDLTDEQICKLAQEQDDHLVWTILWINIKILCVPRHGLIF